ncbi:MAG: isochorismatase family protein [Pirellulales bacterium]
MRLTPSQSTLCVIDVQDKIIPTIPTGQQVITECCRLVEAANLFKIQILCTEQYPKGLGQTVEPITAKLKNQNPIEKLSFSCCGTPTFLDQISPDVETLIVCGIETHICIAQTALDVLQAGFRVCIAVDAVGSYREQDHTVALRRLEGAGAVLSTTEAILFELCGTADNPDFKRMQQLVAR